MEGHITSTLTTIFIVTRYEFSILTEQQMVSMSLSDTFSLSLFFSSLARDTCRMTERMDGRDGLVGGPVGVR